MKPVANAREHTNDRTLGRTQERTRKVVENLNDIDEAITAIAREMRGVLPIAMGNADYTLSLAEAKYSRFRLSGTHTAARKLYVPAESDETAREILIINDTTGGFAVDVVPSDAAATGTVAAAATKRVLLSSTGAKVL